MKEFLANLDARLRALADAAQAVVNVGQPPPITNHADLDAALQFRSRVGLVGPGGDGLPKAAAVLAAGAVAATERAMVGLRTMLQSIEHQLVAAANADQLGLIGGAVLGKATPWGQVFTVAYKDVPDGHPLREQLTQGDCLLAGDSRSLVYRVPLIVFPADRHPRSNLPSKRAWYAAGEVASFTRSCRADQLAAELAEREDLEARRQDAVRQSQSEDNLTPPQRIAKLERHLAALTTKGSQ